MKMVTRKKIFCIVFSTLFMISCGGGGGGGGGDSSDLGGCTVDCSVLGELIDITDYKFISEDECREHADATTINRRLCIVWYCPPTGIEGDCYRVFLDDDGSNKIWSCISEKCPPLWTGGPRDQQCMRDCGYEYSDYAGIVTTANPVGGVYSAPIEIELIANVDDMSPTDICLLLSDPNQPIEIYYTTDNSTPTTSSNLYTNPILISEDTILKFFAIRSACSENEINEENYEID